MLAIRLPNGVRLGPAEGGRIVLGRANLASVKLGPGGVGAISRQQAELMPEADSPGMARLRAIGCNAVVVEKQAAEGADEWVTCDVLEQGESTLVAVGMRFYVASLQENTTCGLERWTEEAAAPQAGPSTAPQQQAPNQQQGQPIDLTMHSDDEDTTEEAGPAPKRQKREHTPAAPPSSATAQLDEDSPFSLFKVRGIPASFNTGVLGGSLCDLVVGDIKLAVVENYLIDIPWLLSAYPALRNANKVLLVHGMKDNASMRAAATSAGWAPQQGLIVHKPPLPKQYSVHHSKAFVLQYDTGVRVVVHTANLLYGDCHHKTQGLWSQDFPLKQRSSPPSSPFERELVEYFAAVQLPAAAAAELRALLQAHDFSSARVHLVASVPGAHSGARLYSFGHMRLRSLLSNEPMDAIFAKAPTIAQCSSLGSLDRKWLLEEFLGSLTAGNFQAAAADGAPGPSSSSGSGKAKLGSPGSQSLVSSWAKPRSGAASGSSQAQPPQPGRTQGVTLNFVWPTVQEVRNSIEGWAAGGSIPGSKANVEKVQAVAASTPQMQFCRWGGEPVGRQRAAPHYKSYTRFDGQRLPWHLVGSHNVSKAAWGQVQKLGSQIFIMHYELAVLSLPSSEAAYRAHPHRGFSCTAPQAEQLPVASHGASEDAGAPQSAAVASSSMQAQSPSTQEQPQHLPRIQFWTTQAAAPSPAAERADIVHVKLPVPYVLPPRQYERNDAPWMHDVAFEGPDILGCFCGSGYSLYGYLDDAGPGEEGACPVQ